VRSIGFEATFRQVDPWVVLGLDPAGATVDDVRDARRRLAKVIHPDVVLGGGGGTSAVSEASDRLAAVNQAVELALADLATRDVSRGRAGGSMPPPSAGDAAVWAGGEDAVDATWPSLRGRIRTGDLVTGLDQLTKEHPDGLADVLCGFDIWEHIHPAQLGDAISAFARAATGHQPRPDAGAGGRTPPVGSAGPGPLTGPRRCGRRVDGCRQTLMNGFFHPIRPAAPNF